MDNEWRGTDFIFYQAEHIHIPLITLLCPEYDTIIDITIKGLGIIAIICGGHTVFNPDVILQGSYHLSFCLDEETGP